LGKNFSRLGFKFQLTGNHENLVYEPIKEKKISKKLMNKSKFKKDKKPKLLR